jgi:hypothetical protein
MISISISPFQFKHRAELKVIVDFATLLIGAEGAKNPAGVWGRGDPAGAKNAEEAPRATPAESKAPGAEINRPVKHSKHKKNQIHKRTWLVSQRKNNTFTWLLSYAGITQIRSEGLKT